MKTSSVSEIVDGSRIWRDVSVPAAGVSIVMLTDVGRDAPVAQALPLVAKLG
jgi:hypothetical protein